MRMSKRRTVNLGVIRPFLYNFEHNRVFTEDEGWMLFRLAAIAEACGWTLLITGIACEHYVVPGNNIPVLIAGQLHGVLFLIYCTAAVGLYPTLHWPRRRMVAALLASVPPYGSLLFEWWAQSLHRRNQFRRYTCCIALAYLNETFSVRP